MWYIYEKKNLAKTIKKLPKEVLKHYELWKQIVELEGPKGLRLIKDYHDEALKGNWNGYRSSRLDKKWRILYKPYKKYFEIYIIDINPHNY